MAQFLKDLGVILNATLMYTPPLLFAALGSCFSEKSGVVNIGLEGMIVIGAFTGAAVGLGSVLLEVIPLPAAKLLGCGMLLILGLVIIVQGFRKRKEENSFSCDFDRSKAIETAEALYLGAALSVDSFGAGVSSAVSGMNSILVPILAGLMQMLFLWGGGFLGKRLKLIQLKNPGVFVYLPGGLLVVLAVLRWFS